MACVYLQTVAFSPKPTSYNQLQQSHHALHADLLHMPYPTATHKNMMGVSHSVVQYLLLFKFREASGQVPKTSVSDIQFGGQVPETSVSDIQFAGTLRQTLSREGPYPASVVSDGIHWRIVLTNARSQSIAFIDFIGSGFLQDMTKAIKPLTVMNQGGGSTKSGVQDCNKRRHMEVWHMGNMNTGEMDAVLEPK